MSVQNTTLKQDATGITVVGGTDLAFTPDGDDVKNGIHLHAADVFDFRVRPNMTLTNKKAAMQADGDFSKARLKLVGVYPKVLASGKTVYPLFRLEVETHPEQTEAEVDSMLNMAAQCPANAALLPFFKTGDLS